MFEKPSFFAETTTCREATVWYGQISRAARVTQLLLRLGHLCAEELTEEERKIPGLLISEKQAIDLEKIVFWDETHTKCAFNQKKQYRFFTDENGKPVPRGTPGAPFSLTISADVFVAAAFETAEYYYFAKRRRLAKYLFPNILLYTLT